MTFVAQIINCTTQFTQDVIFTLETAEAQLFIMDQNDTGKLTWHLCVISSLHDYCNGSITGLPKITTERLQLFQNSIARLLTAISPVLAILCTSFLRHF